MEPSTRNKNLPKIMELIEQAYTERKVQFETGNTLQKDGAGSFLQLKIDVSDPSPELQALISVYSDA